MADNYLEYHREEYERERDKRRRHRRAALRKQLEEILARRREQQTSKA